MHAFSLPGDLIERVVARSGKAHPFDVMDPAKTALVVIDMQNYFLKPGYQGEVPRARDIVAGINRMAAALRSMGGHIVWIKNAADTGEAWSVFNDRLMTADKRDRRFETMDAAHEGHELWAELEVRPDDAQIVKKRFSAFIQDSSGAEAHLRARGIDTLLIAGTATEVCCESSARDGMMLNFNVTMVPDALATYTDEQHGATLRAFYSIFGDVQTIDEAIVSLKRGRAQAAA